MGQGEEHIIERYEYRDEVAARSGFYAGCVGSVIKEKLMDHTRTFGYEIRLADGEVITEGIENLERVKFGHGRSRRLWEVYETRKDYMKGKLTTQGATHILMELWDAVEEFVGQTKKEG